MLNSETKTTRYLLLQRQAILKRRRFLITAFFSVGLGSHLNLNKHYPLMTEKCDWVIGDRLLTLSSFLRLFIQIQTQRGTCWCHTLCFCHNTKVRVLPGFRGKSSSNSYFHFRNMTNAFVKADILKCHQTCRV